MAFSGKNLVFFVLAFLPYAVLQVDALNYANFQSANGMFKLHWTYNNGKLIFKMTCKTTGWCAVGFTATGDGRNMQNYDMAVGGVASNKPYLDGYQSASKGVPLRDPTPDYNLIKASEGNGYTSVEFDRSATTDGDVKDVQFRKNSEVWIVWAWHNNDDASSGLNSTMQKHSATGVSKRKYNLIKEAMNPSSAASETGSRVLAYAILALIACVLSF